MEWSGMDCIEPKMNQFPLHSPSFHLNPLIPKQAISVSFSSPSLLYLLFIYLSIVKLSFERMTHLADK